MKFLTWNIHSLLQKSK